MAEEQEQYVKKMRVQYLDSNLVILRDRLVGQTLELDNGPRETHNGPLRIEVILADQGDVDAFKLYLDRILGKLPLPERKTYKKDKEESNLAPVEEFLTEVKANCNNQEELIQYLRDRNFKFIDATYISDFQIPIEIDKKHDKYQYMVRQTKQAKSINADKWDPQLAFGFILIGDKIDRVLIYLYGKFHEKLSITWANQAKFKLKKTDYTRFPHYMTEEERIKYQQEARVLKLNPEKQPSKFFNRWKPAVDDFNKP